MEITDDLVESYLSARERMAQYNLDEISMNLLVAGKDYCVDQIAHICTDRPKSDDDPKMEELIFQCMLLEAIEEEVSYRTEVAENEKWRIHYIRRDIERRLEKK